MPLTDDEMSETGKLLTRMEKNARPWRYTRWLGVVFGPVMFACGVWSLKMSLDGANSMLLSELPKSYGPADIRMDQMLLLNSSIAFAGGMILIFIGIQLAGWAVGNWRRHKRDCLLIKLAWSYLEDRQSRPE